MRQNARPSRPWAGVLLKQRGKVAAGTARSAWPERKRKDFRDRGQPEAPVFRVWRGPGVLPEFFPLLPRGFSVSAPGLCLALAQNLPRPAGTVAFPPSPCRAVQSLRAEVKVSSPSRPGVAFKASSSLCAASVSAAPPRPEFATARGASPFPATDAEKRKSAAQFFSCHPAVFRFSIFKT